MNIRPTKRVTKLLIASGTMMVILGYFGFRILGTTSDWLAYYTAGHFLLMGDISNLYNLDLVQQWQSQYIGDQIARFLYAPAYSLAFAPLTIFPIKWARLAWLAIGIIAVFLSARISTRWSGLSLGMSLLAALAFPPVIYTLVIGQITPITLLIFCTIACLEFQGRKGYLPGILAGLALYKPQLLIPLGIYWLFSRRWKTIIGLIAAGLSIAILSILISKQATFDFLGMAFSFLDLAEYYSDTGANMSFYAFSTAVGVLVSVTVLLLLIFSIKYKSSPYFSAMLWLSVVLVPPYIFLYNMLLLALPISFLVPAMSRDRLLQIPVVLIWLAALLAPFIVNVRPVLWAAAVLFGICAYRVYKPGSQFGFVSGR